MVSEEMASRRALESIAKSAAEVARTFSTLNTTFANFVETNDANVKLMIAELKVSNEQFDETSMDDRLEQLRAYKDGVEDIAEAAERINKAIPNEQPEAEWEKELREAGEKIGPFTEEDLARNRVARRRSEFDAHFKYPPMPSPKELDDFIGWVFEEAGRQGIDPRNITFVKGTQEGGALMRMKEYFEFSSGDRAGDRAGFEVKLPKGVEPPTPSYMEEHFGHLSKPKTEIEIQASYAATGMERLPELLSGANSAEVLKFIDEPFVGSESWLLHTEILGHKTVTDCDAVSCNGPTPIDKPGNHDDTKD